MFDIDWEKIRICTEIEKREKLPYIDQLMKLQEKFWTKGIDCFDDYLLLADDFEKVSIYLICRGTPPEIVTMILSNIINSTELNSSLYLKYVIFSHFILLMQRGPGDILGMKKELLSYLGITLCTEIMNDDWI